MNADPNTWPEGESRTVLNEDGWSYWITQCGIRSERDLAKALRVSAPALWRVRKGHSEPGNKFIRHALRGLRAVNSDGTETGPTYEQLFTHTDAA